jgi:hypothetical protein
MQPNEATRFTSSFAALNESINRFIAALPPISQLEMTLPAVIRTIFVTHTLAHSACLCLHAIFADADEHSRDKCTVSALAITGLVGDVDLQNFQFINPIIGVSHIPAFHKIFRSNAFRGCRHFGCWHASS